MKNVKNWVGNPLLRYTLGEFMKWNELVNAGSAYDELITTTEVQQLTISDHNQRLKKTKTWRDNAKNTSDGLDKRMKRSHAKKNSHKLCQVG